MKDLRNKRTYYQLILDRSGSMASCIEETISGINSQIRRIRELSARYPEQELITSLTLFNQHVTSVWDRIRHEDLREIDYHQYKPSGNTALYDAIGLSILNLQKNIGREVDADEASVVVVIFTDGYENSSREFSRHRISSIIHELETSGRWTFSYIGATLDAVDIAVNLNIRASNAMSFDLRETETQFLKINDYMERYVSEKSLGKIKKDFLTDSDDNKGQSEKKK